MAGSVTITGTVLEVEHKRGEYEGRPYDFHLAHVLVGRRVVEVRFNGDNADARPPAEGATIALDIELPKGARPVARHYIENARPAVKAAG